jgi:hypothetical protein
MGLEISKSKNSVLGWFSILMSDSFSTNILDKELVPFVLVTNNLGSSVEF